MAKVQRVSLPRFAIHPGKIKLDGSDLLTDISAVQIAFHYRIPLNEWITWCPIVASKYRWDEFIHLYPKPDGNYGFGNEHALFLESQREERKAKDREHKRLSAQKRRTGGIGP